MITEQDLASLAKWAAKLEASAIEAASAVDRITFDVDAWNRQRLEAPPDSTYERQENAISPAAIAAAWRAFEDGNITLLSPPIPGEITKADVANISDYLRKS